VAVTRQTVGLEDVLQLDDEAAVGTAVGRAGANDIVSRWPSGLETQLGPTWPGGVEVSFGQWQKLALARRFMCDLPLARAVRATLRHSSRGVQVKLARGELNAFAGPAPNDLERVSLVGDLREQDAHAPPDL
jgi:hypothetical protein